MQRNEGFAEREHSRVPPKRRRQYVGHRCQDRLEMIIDQPADLAVTQSLGGGIDRDDHPGRGGLQFGTLPGILARLFQDDLLPGDDMPAVEITNRTVTRSSCPARMVRSRNACPGQAHSITPD